MGTLPAAVQRRLKGRVAVHSILYSRSTIAPGLFDPEHERDLPPVRQALVRARLLDDLLAHATRPEGVYTHGWGQFDLVMWDNRAVLHRGRPWDSARYPRVMRRTTVASDGPTADPPFATRTPAWDGIIPEGVGAA